MKNEILTYLQFDRNFDTGVRIYYKYGRNKYLLRKFNIQGGSKENIELLHYKLFQLTGLPERNFLEIMRKPIAPPPEPAEKKMIEPQPAQAPSLEKEMVEPAAQPQTITPIEATKKRIRDEFPFLSEKNCPDSFKILVADMITSYEKYIEAHKQLFDVKDEKDAFDVADKVIDNYLENRAIWDELNHYKETGKILGKHKYFEGEKRRKELMKKTVPELIKLKEQLEMNVWRNQKNIKDDPKPHLLKDRQKRIAKYEKDLETVNFLLNTK